VQVYDINKIVLLTVRVIYHYSQASGCNHRINLAISQ